MSDKSEPLGGLEGEQKEGAEETIRDREEKRTPWDQIKTAIRRTRQSGHAAKSPGRREMGKDRTKSLVLLAGAAVGMVLMFLGVFSSPQKPQSTLSHRAEPDLGRRMTPGQPPPGSQPGSVTPVMDAAAAKSPAEAAENEVTAADISRTGRSVQPAVIAPDTANSPHALSEIDFSDPALQRQYARHGYITAPPPPTPVLRQATTIPENNGLSIHSLVFVRSLERDQSRPADGQSVVESQGAVADILPTGSRLVARLESPVSSAVAAPVVAVIEYNYERDGEIVVPAGARALGKLQQANSSGYVSLHFDTLQMPDGSPERIDAGAMGLDYKPLKGSVAGRKRGARFLVESLTGLGTVASYLVGNNYSSLNAPFSSSALLRERMAGNVAIAGQDELNEMAVNQNVVVTLPGGTRFYLVLQKGTTPGAGQPTEQRGAARPQTANASVPSLEELRQLLELKRELSQMYEQAGVPEGSSPSQ